MSNFFGLELSSSITKPSIFKTITFFPFIDNLTTLKIPLISSSASLLPPSLRGTKCKAKGRRISRNFKVHTANSSPTTRTDARNLATSQVEEKVEVKVAEGYTITQFCDKIIDVFLNEKPKSREWRKYLVFREEWHKYRETFYNRCITRADMETEPTMKQKLISLGRKVKKVL